MIIFDTHKNFCLQATVVINKVVSCSTCTYRLFIGTVQHNICLSETSPTQSVVSSVTGKELKNIETMKVLNLLTDWYLLLFERLFFLWFGRCLKIFM
jgi:hypothetical protein